MSNLEGSIVLITSASDNSRKADVVGTGFAFYREDNYTYLLTCAHVVEDVGGKENVLVNDIPAEVLAIGDVKNFDLAVLGVENLKVELFCLTSLSAAENVKFRTAGHFLYGEEKKILLETVEGTLGKKRFARKNHQTVAVWKLLINEGDRLRKGYSGALVVDLETGGVLGIATDMEKDGREGLAISVEALEKIWPQMPPFISDVIFDYHKLNRLLSEGKWFEANKETVRCMLKVARREKEGTLRVEDIEKFPCGDLRTIDELWVKYSDGKFGFSVQKKIYQSLGGTKKYDEKVFRSFGDKVGWRQGGKWLYYNDLTFSLDTHFGHLPKLPFVRLPSVFDDIKKIFNIPDDALIRRRGRDEEDEDEVQRHLFSRAETCRI